MTARSNKKRLDKKALLVMGGLLGVETLACLGAGLSIHGKRTALEQTLAGKEKALDDVRTVAASLPGLQFQFEKMQAQVRYLEQSLPPAEYIPTLLGQVEHTARVCGVKIQDFRPKQTPGGPGSGPAAPAEGSGASADGQSDGTSKVQFDMTVRGSYRQIQQFLQSLTKFRKILALDSITLQPNKSDQPGVSPFLNGSLSFTAYVLPPSAMTQPAPAPMSAPATAAATARTAASHAAGTASGAARQLAADRGLTPRTEADPQNASRG